MEHLITDLTAQARAREIIFTLKNYYPEKNIKILDVGCGSGYYVNYLRSAGYNVLGLDKFDSEEASWIVVNPDFKMDATKMSFKDSSFDVILAIELLEHCNCLNEIRRVLKPDGLLIATTPSKHTDWLHHLVELLHLGEVQDGGYKNHKYINLRRINMWLLDYKKMFFGTSQFGVFEIIKEGKIA